MLSAHGVGYYDTLGVSETQDYVYSAVTSVPGDLIIVCGILADCFPLGGYHVLYGCANHYWIGNSHDSRPRLVWDLNNYPRVIATPSLGTPMDPGCLAWGWSLCEV